MCVCVVFCMSSALVLFLLLLSSSSSSSSHNELDPATLFALPEQLLTSFIRLLADTDTDDEDDDDVRPPMDMFEATIVAGESLALDCFELRVVLGDDLRVVLVIVSAVGSATMPEVELLTTLILLTVVRGISMVAVVAVLLLLLFVGLLLLLVLLVTLLVNVVAVLDGIGSPNVVTFTVFLTLLLVPATIEGCTSRERDSGERDMRGAGINGLTLFATNWLALVTDTDDDSVF